MAPFLYGYILKEDHSIELGLGHSQLNLAVGQEVTISLPYEPETSYKAVIKELTFTTGLVGYSSGVNIKVSTSL